MFTQPTSSEDGPRILRNSSFSAAVVKILFDIDVADEDDETIAIIENVLEWLGEELTPGKYLVEVLPALKYIPAWFPGATVQRLSAYWKSTIERLKEEPYHRVKAARVSYTAIKSF